MTPLIQWIEAELTPAAGRAGYLVVAIGVLVGSIIPIVPTGAVVGAAAAVAMTIVGAVVAARPRDRGGRRPDR